MERPEGSVPPTDPTARSWRKAPKAGPAPQAINNIVAFAPAHPVGDCAIPVVRSAQVPNDGKLQVQICGRKLLLIRNFAGQLFAVQDACTHERASLSQGVLDGARIGCIYHQSRFDYATGACVSGGCRSLQTYDVSEANGMIFLDPRGLTDKVAQPSKTPFLTKLTGAGTPAIQSTDSIGNTAQRVYENITSPEHLVGVHGMRAPREIIRESPRRIVFRSPLDGFVGEAIQRYLRGRYFATTTIEARPPFASLVELRVDPQDERRDNILLSRILMYVTPITERQSLLHTSFYHVPLLPASLRKLPGAAWLTRAIDELWVRPQVDKAIREDREVIEMQEPYNDMPLHDDETRAFWDDPPTQPAVSQAAQQRLDAARLRPRRRIVVFGASGKTGRATVQELLDDGHYVKAFVRNEWAFEGLGEKRFTYYRGDVKDGEHLREAMDGQDAVVLSLGPKRGEAGGSNICSEATPPILDAMKALGVPRLLCVSSYGVADSWQRLSGTEKFFFRLAMGDFLADKQRQEDLIRQQSGINWTILQPRQLTDGDQREAHVCFDGSTKSPRVSRRAVGRYIAKALLEGETFGRTVALSGSRGD